MTRLGNSDLNVFPLALGANTLGWTADEGTSFAILDAFVEAGGNLIDTADNYSIWAEGNVGGESEIIIGRWLASRDLRDDVLIATKVSRHPDFLGLGRASISGGVEESLRRLGVDRIDVYYAHYDDPATPVEESAATFHELQQQGKIGHVGLSNYTAKRLEEWISVARAHGWELPVAFQPHYNLVHRQPYERELAPIVQAAQIGVVPYFGLASGLLSGKYGSAEEVNRSDRRVFTEKYSSPESFAVVDVLHEIAREQNVAVPTVALAWLRDAPGVVAPLASVRTADQLPALTAIGRFSLDADSRARLDSVSSRVPEEQL